MLSHTVGTQNWQKFCNSDFDLGKLGRVFLGPYSQSMVGTIAGAERSELFNSVKGHGGRQFVERSDYFHVVRHCRYSRVGIHLELVSYECCKGLLACFHRSSSSLFVFFRHQAIPSHWSDPLGVPPLERKLGPNTCSSSDMVLSYDWLSDMVFIILIFIQKCT